LSTSCLLVVILLLLFFFNDTATPETSPLSLHDALPICLAGVVRVAGLQRRLFRVGQLLLLAVSLVRRRDDHVGAGAAAPGRHVRSEEHTSELQSLTNLVCRLLLEKKKQKIPTTDSSPLT